MSATVVLAGGGTAGHVNPLLSIAAELRARGAQVRVLGTREGLESDLVPAAGYRLTALPKVPLVRHPSPQWLTLPVRFREAVHVAASALDGADALVGFGGYVSTPAYVAARRAGVPFLVHEQNARPGLANRVGARSARVVALTFASTPLRAARGRTVLTGLPLRPAVAELARARRTPEGRLSARRAAAARLGLDPQRRTLVVTGGSLGALHVNQAVTGAAADFPEGVQVLHLTGRGKDADVRAALARSGSRAAWTVLDYLTTMQDAFAVADLVLGRSGASTVSELCALGLPAFYVPLAIGNGEQHLNAADQVRAGGARIVADRAFSARTVREQVIPLLVGEALPAMGRAAASCGRVEATRALTDLALDVAQGRETSGRTGG